jgi:hypothetical protein
MAQHGHPAAQLEGLQGAGVGRRARGHLGPGRWTGAIGPRGGGRPGGSGRHGGRALSSRAYSEVLTTGTSGPEQAATAAASAATQSNDRDMALSKSAADGPPRA